MESVHGHGTHNASKCASEDIISRMPGNVITNILDRLPIQEAVRTGILSRNWRFSWTMLSRLVFDFDFFKYLLGIKGERLFYKRNLSRFLLHFKGFITKFVLYIPVEESIVDDEDISHWILFLSTKGMNELFLINNRKTPLKLPTHLFSCMELKHLMLSNCCFRPVRKLCGFPNLSSFYFDQVRYESCNCGEFIAQCPSLEILKIKHHDCNGEVKPVEIAKLENLKMLSLSLSKLANMAITSSGIFQLIGFLPKLQELDLDFYKCKFLAEAGARKKITATLPCLKTLSLSEMDFNSFQMVLCACDLIRGFPHLQTLKITATCTNHASPSPVGSWEMECGIMGKLQLQNVELEGIRGWELEVCLIKSLLAYSSLLKKMVINHAPTILNGGSDGNYPFATKLLKLHRASPIAEIHLC